MTSAIQFTLPKITSVLNVTLKSQLARAVNNCRISRLSLAILAS
uniref:Uncharacterized protein n=1 Tax=Anguilla anguilla TaxID=7936 RepID=A0A0E9WGL8_ANGAN